MTAPEPTPEELLAALSDEDTGAFSVREVATYITRRRRATIDPKARERAGETQPSLAAVRFRLRRLARMGAVVVVPGHSRLLRLARPHAKAHESYYVRRDRLVELAERNGTLDAALSVLIRRRAGELREVVESLARDGAVDGLDLADPREDWGRRPDRDRDRVRRVLRSAVAEVRTAGGGAIQLD